MSASAPELSRRQSHSDAPLWRAAVRAFSPALLVLQPILFYWHILINPSAHIPYDIEGFHLPLIAYIAQCIRQGVAPLWDPYSFGGMPIHADLQAQVFYPFTFLAVLAGNLSHGRYLFYWVETLVPLHMILGGLFAFLLLRRMGLARPAALMGASIYQLGGFFASQAQHLCAICTGAWLPLAILAVFELRHRFRPRWAAVLAIAIALSVLSGFAATTLIVGVAVLLVTAGWLITREASWQVLPGVAAGFVAGAAIAAVELVPLWMLSHASIAAERARWHAFGGGVPIEILPSLVIPDYYHIFEIGSLYTLPYNFTFLYAYCGIASLALILLAPMIRRRRAVLFFALTVLSVFWMLGENTPVYRTIYVHLPDMLRGALYAEYATMAFTFFAGITAAIVLDRFAGRWPQALMWGVALFTSYDLIHTGADRPMNSYRGGPKIEDSDFRADAELVATAIHTAAGPNTPSCRVDYTDLLFDQGILGPGMLGIPTTAGDNPFQLLRVMHVRRLYATGNAWDRNLVVNRIDSPLLNMLNVCLLAGGTAIPTADIAKAGLEPLQPERGIQIYRNPHALPRFFLVPRIHRSAGEAETLRMLSQSSFNPAEEAIVEGLPADRNGLAAGAVQVSSYEPNRIRLTVAVERPAFLVTSEVMYPGWEATVNGAPQPLLMTNGAFRGLALPAGKSRIVMEYHPWGLAASLWLSLLALVGTITVGLVSERRRGAAPSTAADALRSLWLGSRQLAGKCVAAALARRAAIGSAVLIFLIIALFYWKIVLTSQFSLLTGTEAVNQSYTWLQFCVYNIRHGTQPLWDPYTFGGHPFDGQGGGFNPLHLLLALASPGKDGLLSPHLYHLWFVFLHFLGACFMFALAREFRLGRLPALVAAICFSLGGFVGATGNISLLEGAIWLPLTLLFLLRAARAANLQTSIKNAAMSGLALGMTVLAGNGDMVAMQVVVIISAAIVGAKSHARAVVAMAVVVATGFAAGALEWLPRLGTGVGVGSGDASHLSIGVFPFFLFGVAGSVLAAYGVATLFRYRAQSRSRPWFQALMVALILIGLHAFDRLPQNRHQVAAQANQLDRLLHFGGAAQFLRRQREPWRAKIDAEPRLSFAEAFRVETIDASETRPELWNVRYRVQPASAQDPAPVYQDGYWKIYEIPASPRAWMVHRTIFEPSRDGQLATLRTAGFDLWGNAAIDGHVKLQDAIPGAGDSVSYIRSQGNRVEAEVYVKSRGLLVLSERFAPGWHAMVNGKETRIYRVDGDLRGIVLDRGDDRIMLEYRPELLYVAWILTLGAWLGSLG